VTFDGSVVPIYPGHSASHPFVAVAVSTGDGFGHRWGRNGEFCIAVGPVTRAAGILGYCVLA